MSQIDKIEWSTLEAWSEKLDEVSEWLNEMAESLNRERLLISHLAYLNVLWRLWENRNLDLLFDWDVENGEDELFAIYAILDIANWNDTFSWLKPPRKIDVWLNNLRRDLEVIPNYTIQTDWWDLNKNTLDGIDYSRNWLFNDCSLQFERDTDWLINKMIFDRPGLSIYQDILFERNEQWLVVSMEVRKAMELDNHLTIEYNDEWKPIAIYQTKTWLLEDKMFFIYDEQWKLVNITYMPTISLKRLLNSADNIWRSTTVKEMWQVIWREVLRNSKYFKWYDVVNIDYENWLPVSTDSKLSASNMFRVDSDSESEYDDEWKLESRTISKDEMIIDNVTSIRVRY